MLIFTTGSQQGGDDTATDLVDRTPMEWVGGGDIGSPMENAGIVSEVGQSISVSVMV